jgi:hypothetical protein
MVYVILFCVVSCQSEILLLLKLLKSSNFCSFLLLLIVIKLEHLCDILIEYLEKIEYALILKLKFLFNFDVSFQERVPDEINKNFDARIDETLQLVDYHFFIVSESHVMSCLFHMHLRVSGHLQDVLKVRIIKEWLCVANTSATTDYAFSFVEAGPNDGTMVIHILLVLDIISVFADDV